MTVTRAIILAAGLGTRMRPLTNEIPKPLIPVQGKPLIDYCLEWLEGAGVREVVINTSYRAAQLEEYLSKRTSPHIQVSREEPAPLETGGGIVKALPILGDAPFLAMNSDAIFAPTNTHPILRMTENWSEELDFLMLLIPTACAIGWEGNGDFVMEENGRIRRPREGEAAPYIFSGAEIIHPRVFEGAPTGAFSLSKLWNARVDAEGYFQNIQAIAHDGDWLNVGDLKGLQSAENYFGGASAGSRT